MKKLLSVLLALALCLSPALAATQDLFPARYDYAGFSDVAEGEWYAEAVAVCCRTGLMQGVGEGNFSPDGVMTVAEAATIAARIRETLTGQAIVQPQAAEGEAAPWYQGYVDYLTQAGVTVALPTQRATRAQFFAYLAAVIPDSELAPINAITALPDTGDADVLRFYNAGVLTGTDEYGTFQAAGSLSRAECATMVARILRPDLRVRFTPEEKPAPEAADFQTELDGTLAMLVNGQTVSMREFVSSMDNYIFESDYSLYVNTGKRLDWSADYGVGDLGTFFLEQTKSGVIRDVLQQQQAKALGCGTDELAGTLTPDPSYEVLSAYAQGMDYLAAKHILLQTWDPNGGEVYSDEDANALAQQLIAAMDSQPSLQQFENLMALYNDDPGMTSYPEGYLFSAGEMVEEFEAAVRALEVGEYSAQPVKSVYGYNVILRLDPAGLSELKEEYQEAVLDNLLDTWVESASVTVNDVMLGRLDVQGCYEAYWQALTQAYGQN